jgi:hypothetical protein
VARTRIKYCPDHPEANSNGMVPLEDYWDWRASQQECKRSGLPSPYFTSDIMEPTRHMASGAYFTSKAAFRAETKRTGCVEIGNEVATMLKPRKPIPLDRRKRREDIRRALREASK